MITAQLPYGADLELQFQLADGAELVQCGVPAAEAITDVAAAAAAALAAPLDYPPLADATAPGDQIAIVLEAGVPQAPAIVAGVVHTLLARHATPEEICIVASPEAAGAEAVDPRAELPADVAAAVRYVVHEPTNRESLGFLAPDREGKPIYINRQVADADVVIPIGVARLDDSALYDGPDGGLYPALADAAAREHFRALAMEETPAAQRRRREDVAEAVRQLGAAFVLQAAPGGGDQVLQLLAGEQRAVQREAARLCEAAWRTTVPQRAELVVVALSGGAQNQTWENVARALAVARGAVEDGGAIVVLSELEEPLGPALQRLIGAEDRERALRAIRKRKPTDAATAAQLIRTLDQGRVYLLSRLDEELVFDLGLTPLASAEELSRLAASYGSCLTVANAQFAGVRIAEDT